MNGKYEIDESTYKNMTPEDRDWIMFKTFNDYRKITDDDICELKKKVSLWKKVDLSVSAITGVIGGFLASFFKP